MNTSNRRMSEMLAELYTLRLLQPHGGACDFRMPTARIYVPLVTEYATKALETPPMPHRDQPKKGAAGKQKKVK